MSVYVDENNASLVENNGGWLYTRDPSTCTLMKIMRYLSRSWHDERILA